jgi:DNA-binding SARP family transcriptional activator/tetratricopeptide (TPR) repeat protein
MRFRILGPTQLIDHEKSVPLGAAKQRGMLAMLLYRAGEPVRVETLIEHLWHNSTNADHRRTLYSLASRLRAVLGRVGLTGVLTRVANTDAYCLLIDPDLVDYHQFRRSLAEARDAAAIGDHERSATTLVGALATWRGEPLAELCGPHTDDLRRRLNDTLLDAHKLLAQSWLRTGRHESVLTQLEPIVHDQCLDEALARSWITALSAAGRHDEARRFLIDFRRRFRREMRTEADIDPDIVAAPASAGDRPGPARAAVPHQLPKNIADFTGRVAILGELDELESPDRPQGRVVVITGMPGVGKTTLATHWAHRQRRHFPDGQLYLNAGAYGPSSPVDPHDALDRFLRGLDVPADCIPSTFEQRRDRYNQLLHGRRMLIVLDNVLDSAQARALTPDTETCTTVITSRTRLSGLTIRDGVRHLTVPPLDEAESIELLRQVIGVCRADAEPESMTLVARLAGGHPLGLRIIGEHIAERPRAGIGDLAIELRDRLLDAGGEIDEATSVPTVFGWSYDALSGDAALLFRRLAVHPGPTISAEAANAVVGADVAHTLTLLNALAKAHLINHDTARHYRFHDLLRLYAQDRGALEDDGHETERAQHRLLDWYLLSAANAAATLAPEWPAMPDLPAPRETQPMSFRTDIDAMRWCATERENLCAVSRWAALNGYDRHGWQIPGVIHEIFERYGRQDDIVALTELALGSAQRDGHELGQIGTLTNLGAIYLTMHSYARAATTFARARELANATGHIEAETVCTHNLGSAYLSSGETERAIGVYTLVLAACRKISDPAGESATLHRLGDAYLNIADYDRAADHYCQALHIRERIGALRGRGITHTRLANLYLVTGELRSAMRHGEIALAIHHRTNDQAMRCDALATLTDVRVRLGMVKEALESGRQSVEISDEIADSHRRAHALAVLADALVRSDAPGAADQPCRTALRILDEVADTDTRALRQRLRNTQRAIGAT